MRAYTTASGADAGRADHAFVPDPNNDDALVAQIDLCRWDAARSLALDRVVIAAESAAANDDGGAA